MQWTNGAFICSEEEVELWRKPRDRKHRAVAEIGERIRRKEAAAARLLAEITRLKAASEREGKE